MSNSSQKETVSDSQALLTASQWFQTEPVLDIQGLNDSALQDEAVQELLSQHRIDWICPLANGEILFSRVTSRDIALVRKVTSIVKRSHPDLDIQPRPAKAEVVDFALQRSGLDFEGRSVKERQKQRDESVLPQDAGAGRSTIQRLLDLLISAADRNRASDVHVETNAETDTALIKYRIDGDAIAQRHATLQWREQDAIDMAQMIMNWEAQGDGGSAKETFDRHKPRDGSFRIQPNDKTVKVRYSHVPTESPEGLSIVMRILPGSGEDTSIPTFYELGYSPDETALQERAFNFPHGLVLYTGPTGSGKTTALAAGVSTLPSTKKILSYEDPVEIHLPNVNQVQVGGTQSTNYAAYARAALRQDPDVIMYGEIRDSEVVDQVTFQANTGHLVVSTLHTNTAPETIQRMVDLGCDWSRLAAPSFIRAIVGQRLVKKICHACSISLEEAVEQEWVTTAHQRIYSYFESIEPGSATKIQTLDASADARGCPTCEGKGAKGRLPIVEVVMMDEVGRSFIKERDISGWFEHLKIQGFEDLADKCIKRIVNGEVCPLQAEKTLETPFGMRSETFDYREFQAAFGVESQPHSRDVSSTRAVEEIDD